MSMLMLLLWPIFGPPLAPDVVWEPDHVARWTPGDTKLFTYRFGFTYTSGALDEIILVITRDEKPGQPAAERSPVFRFTRSGSAEKSIWICNFQWNGRKFDKDVPYTSGNLVCRFLNNATDEGDMYLSGKLTYYPSTFQNISDARYFEGTLFFVSSTDN